MVGGGVQRGGEEAAGRRVGEEETAEQAERGRRSSFAPRGAGAAAGPAPAITVAAASATSSRTRCTRLATREVYFFNSATGETAWTLPLGGVIVAEMSQ